MAAGASKLGSTIGLWMINVGRCFRTRIARALTRDRLFQA